MGVLSSFLCNQHCDWDLKINFGFLLPPAARKHFQLSLFVKGLSLFQHRWRNVNTPYMMNKWCKGACNDSWPTGNIEHRVIERRFRHF